MKQEFNNSALQNQMPVASRTLQIDEEILRMLKFLQAIGLK